MIVKCSMQTPLGEMIAVVEQGSLCGLWFVGQKYAPINTGEFLHDPKHPVFTALRKQLNAYFAGQLLEFDLPVAPQGTPFQIAVWALLRNIVVGTTSTYGFLATELAEHREGRVPAAQAVGGAVGRNPVSIIIPCHRVIGVNGTLTGYAGGLDRKAALLALEKCRVSH